MSRAEQVERNRELVLDAARRVFLRRGYGGTSLEAIAEEAGFSKGVMYSQFGSKADLFLTLLERRITDRAAENAAIAADGASGDGVLELLRVGARQTEENTDWRRLLIEFRVHAARDPELNRRYAALHAHTVEAFAEAIRGAMESHGIQPPVSPRYLAEFVLAFDQGCALERAANPSALPLAVAEEMVARAIGAPAATTTPANR